MSAGTADILSCLREFLGDVRCPAEGRAALPRAAPPLEGEDGLDRFADLRMQGAAVLSDGGVIHIGQQAALDLASGYSAPLGRPTTETLR